MDENPWSGVKERACADVSVNDPWLRTDTRKSTDPATRFRSRDSLRQETDRVFV